MISGMARDAEDASNDAARELLWRAADRASKWALEGQATVHEAWCWLCSR